MPPSQEQVAALLSKYQAIAVRAAKERDAMKKALEQIATSCPSREPDLEDFSDLESDDALIAFGIAKGRFKIAELMRSALSRPERGMEK